MNDDKRNPFGRGGLDDFEDIQEENDAKESAENWARRKSRLVNSVLTPILAAISLAKSKPKISIGAGAAVGLATIGLTTMHFLDPETHLRNRDPNYLEKCFSYNIEASMKAPMAQKRADKILSIVDEFGSKGQNTVEKLKSDDAIFCYGMDDTPEKDHWSVTNVYLSPLEEPDSLSALFYAKADFESFWSRATDKPSSINEYTPESGLIFSRAARATYAVEKIKNAYRAIKKVGDYQNIMTSEPWVTFFNENPTYKNVIPTYIETMQGKGDEALAMREAMQNLMQDQNFLQDGDIKYLNGYLYHVENQQKSEYKDIYITNADAAIIDLTGVDVATRYAFVDADRDGVNDDLVRLNSFNQAIEYNFDVSKWSYTQKVNEYECKDAEGKETTCSEDINELVYYIKIPAIETATMTLNPETLEFLAGKTDTGFLSSPDGKGKAQRIVSEMLGGELRYAQPHSNEVRELISKIKTAHHQNISGRQIPVTTAKPTFGLN